MLKDLVGSAVDEKEAKRMLSSIDESGQSYFHPLFTTYYDSKPLSLARHRANIQIHQHNFNTTLLSHHCTISHHSGKINFVKFMELMEKTRNDTLRYNKEEEMRQSFKVCVFTITKYYECDNHQNF